MRNSFTLLEVLDRLASSQGNDTKNRLITDNRQEPKKETIANIIAYAKSIRCYKTKSIDKVLLVLN